MDANVKQKPMQQVLEHPQVETMGSDAIQQGKAAPS
jgi:hypothetical protein